MNRAIGLLQANMQPTEGDNLMGVPQGVISRLWKYSRENGSLAEQCPGHGRFTAAAQGRFLR